MRLKRNMAVLVLVSIFIYEAEAKLKQHAKTTAELRQAARKATAQYEAGQYNPFGFDRFKKRAPASEESHIGHRGPTPFERNFVKSAPNDKPVQKTYRAKEGSK